MTQLWRSCLDNIHRRAGKGTAHAEFTNIVFAAQAQGVGLPVQPAPVVLILNPQQNRGSIECHMQVHNSRKQCRVVVEETVQSRLSGRASECSRKLV